MILGIDPGLNITGYSLIKIASNNSIYLVHSGVIKSSPKEAFQEKLRRLYENIDTVCKLYKPRLCGIEETFVNTNAASSLKLGSARGALIAAVAMNNIKVFEYGANKIKKTVTGAGKAEKMLVEFMVTKLVTNVGKVSPDEADSIAVAFTCLTLDGR